MTDVQKKRPWFKWYPSDWRGEPSLRMVSRAARSVWVDMLGLMHESTLIGYLLLNGKKPTPEQLARVLGDDIQDLVPLLEELAAAGVYSETEDGIIFSRRMVRDQERSEKGRADIELRGGAWSKTGKNTERSPSKDPIRGANGDPTTYILDARSQNKDTVGTGVPTVPEPKDDPGFEEFWKAYPRTPNMSKQEARKSWAKLAKEGALPEPARMQTAVDGYKRFLAEQSKNRREPHPAAHAATWLNQRRYDGFLDQTIATGRAALAVATGPGWEAKYPKWATIREFFQRQHGNDVVWQNFFANVEARSETELVCHSRFQRDQLVEKFAEKLIAIIGAPIDFVYEPRATH